MSAPLEMIANAHPPVRPEPAGPRPDQAVRERSSGDTPDRDVPDAAAVRTRRVSMAAEDLMARAEDRLPEGKPKSIDMFV
jgi:hypothetical protein